MARAKRSSLKQTAESRIYWRNDKEAISHFHSLLNQRDVIFISFHLEGRGDIGNSRIDEIGISILDTRQLKEKPVLLSSRHICTRYRGKYFLFGNSEYRRAKKGLGAWIKNLFYIEDIDQYVSQL